MTRALKNKENSLVQVNPLFQSFDQGKPWEVRLEQVCCEEAEVDKQGAFVGNKSNQRGLWHVVDYIDAETDEIGKINTQKIECKSLNFRIWIKRLTRRTICFSTLEKMYDIVMGLLINKVEFGRNTHA